MELLLLSAKTVVCITVKWNCAYYLPGIELGTGSPPDYYYQFWK